MQQVSYNKPGAFSDRKVSVDRAIKILSNNGIDVNEKQVKVILDFLYLLAKMHRVQTSGAQLDNCPEREIEHEIII